MESISVIREAFTLLMRVCNVSERELADAFNTTSERRMFYLPKRSGGSRKIVAFHPDEALVQSRLLHRLLTRLVKRHNYYWSLSEQPKERGLSLRRLEKEKGMICGQESIRPLFSPHIHGGRLKRNVRTALLPHTAFETPFVMKFDLQDAYGSITRAHLEPMLRRILLGEIDAYYLAYEERLKVVGDARAFMEDAKAAWGEVFPYLPKPMLSIPPITASRRAHRKYLRWHKRVGDVIAQHNLVHILGKWEVWMSFAAGRFNHLPIGKDALNGYPRHPLFPANSCSEFRTLIRNAVFGMKSLSTAGITDVVEVFLQHVLDFVTHDGVVPQGAPTSGLLLNLVLSDSGVLEEIRSMRGVKELTIYVDDMIVTFDRRPSEEVLRNISDTVLRSGIFRLNDRKTRVHDLRAGAAHMLGARLNRRVARDGEPEQQKAIRVGYSGDIRGLANNRRKKREWFQTFLTLPKATQKRYRGFLHSLTIKEGTVEEIREKFARELAIANGYHGHIMSVYGWPVMFMPASLRDVVHAFRQKYHTPPLERKRHNEPPHHHLV